MHRLARLVDCNQHPKAHKCYFHAVTVIYVIHVLASVASGLNVDSVASAAVSTVHIIEHVASH